jgi:hypothetical protein
MKFRFSLRVLLIATTLLAVAVGYKTMGHRQTAALRQALEARDSAAVARLFRHEAEARALASMADKGFRELRIATQQSLADWWHDRCQIEITIFEPAHIAGGRAEFVLLQRIQGIELVSFSDYLVAESVESH